MASESMQTPPPVSATQPPPPPPPPPALGVLPSQSNPSQYGASPDTCYEPLLESDDAWIGSVQSSLQHLPSWKQSIEDSTSDWMWMVCNTSVSSVIQKSEQPVCGLLALGMASEMLSIPWKNIWDVVVVAKEQGFTRYGEMFSAKWLLDLAKGAYGMDGIILEGNLLEKTDTLMKHLAEGNPILIAYDTDANFEPCCRKGHKAHWAVLTGFLFRVKTEQVNRTNVDQLQQDKVIQNLYHLPKPPIDVMGIPLPCNPEDIFVLAKQGKSKRCGLWSLAALCESNSNLRELSPAREADERNYVIPEEGVKGGLADQAILLKLL